MKIKTPGKLILSGEYAVVQGKPALVMTVPYFVDTQLQRSETPGVTLNGKHKTWDTLLNLDIQLQHRYQRFIDHDIFITEVLHSPEELCWFAIIHLLFQTHRIPDENGIELKMETTIPMGCGMGSSAAVIINLMQAINAYYELNLSRTTLYQYALAAENLQHGHSSGTDVKIILEGGLRLFERHETQLLSTMLPTLQLVHTGKPKHSTGECVTQVNRLFPREHPIWNAFEHCTRTLADGLSSASIRDNHRLLQQIGVVPEKVAKFIDAIEAQGGAAKICGAGSIAGDSAGIVMVLHDSSVHSLCQAFSYTLLDPISEATHGSAVL